MKKSIALLLVLILGITLLAGCGDKPVQQTPAPTEKEAEIMDMADYTIALVDGWVGRDIGGGLDLRNPGFKASDVSDDEAYILIYSWSSGSANARIAEMIEKNPEKNEQLDNFICNGVEYLRLTTTAGTRNTILYTSYGTFNPDSRGYIEIKVGTIADFDKFLPILKTIKLK